MPKKTPNYTPEGRKVASETAKAIIGRYDPDELQARLQAGQKAYRERVAKGLRLLEDFEAGNVEYVRTMPPN